MGKWKAATVSQSSRASPSISGLHRSLGSDGYQACSPGTGRRVFRRPVPARTNNIGEFAIVHAGLAGQKLRRDARLFRS
jgi:hypothetical protein